MTTNLGKILPCEYCGADYTHQEIMVEQPSHSTTITKLLCHVCGQTNSLAPYLTPTVLAALYPRRSSYDGDLDILMMEWGRI